jgi:PilZ domain
MLFAVNDELEAGRADRRAVPRFSVALPVILTAFNPITKRVHEENTWTRDASSRGLYLYAETGLPEGSEFDFTLLLESGLPGARYRARVVRVEPLEEGTSGIGAVTRFVDFLPEQYSKRQQ